MESNVQEFNQIFLLLQDRISNNSQKQEAREVCSPFMIIQIKLMIFCCLAESREKVAAE